MATPPKNCQVREMTIVTGDFIPSVKSWIKVTVRRIAMGSFAADSTLIVVASLGFMGFSFVTIKTAAASVDEIIEAIKKEVRKSSFNTK